MRTFYVWRTLSIQSVLICLLGLFGATKASAGVIYQYVEVGTGVVLGTLEVESPPASASVGWSTTDDSDLVGLFLDDAVFGFGSGNLLVGNTVSFTASSLTGVTLDAGGVSLSFPTIPGDPTVNRALSLIFDLPSGADFGAAATTSIFSSGEVVVADQFVDGDWVVQRVPEPGTFALFALALLAGLWHSRRPKK